MTKKEIVLGVVALVATLLLGLVIGTHLKKSNGFLGSVQTSPSHLVDTGTLNNQGSLYLYDTQTGGGLEVAGTIYANGNLSVSGSSSINYLVGGENTLFTSFNAASTTVVAVQNTSGQDRIITSAFINLNAGTAANTANSAWRGYVSPGRADNNTTSTNVLFRTATLNSSTVAVAYGGPVQSSYYVSSTFMTGGSGVSLVTTTPVMWYNGTFINVTTTAITSSTGSVVIYFQPFLNQ